MLSDEVTKNFLEIIYHIQNEEMFNKGIAKPFVEHKFLHYGRTKFE